MHVCISVCAAGYGEMEDACSLHGFEPCAGPSEVRPRPTIGDACWPSLSSY